MNESDEFNLAWDKMPKILLSYFFKDFFKAMFLAGVNFQLRKTIKELNAKANKGDTKDENI